MPVPELSAEECRVLGCLIEKERTTPQQYPLSLNALTLACNQTTNRDPVVAYGEPEVQEAVTSLKTLGLARFVHPSHGRSVLRFRHVVDEELRLDEGERSVLAVLLLRGPQTPGELRARTDRMAELGDAAGVESVLERLGGRPDPLVRCLGRQPGQKEDRYIHLLGAVAAPPPSRPAATAPVAQPAPSAPVTPGTPAVPTGPAEGAPDAGTLAAEVAALRADVAALRADVAALRRDLGA
ncbi:MAG TPA: YceH family protein [Acidimicrobiales bacterium]|nr:YceH family protein [Acidimicrobiales bacterium]